MMPATNPSDLWIGVDPRRGAMHPDGYWDEMVVQEFTINTSGLQCPVVLWYTIDYTDPVASEDAEHPRKVRLFGHATEEAIPSSSPEYDGVGGQWNINFDAVGGASFNAYVLFGLLKKTCHKYNHEWVDQEGTVYRGDYFHSTGEALRFINSYDAPTAYVDVAVRIVGGIPIEEPEIESFSPAMLLFRGYAVSGGAVGRVMYAPVSDIESHINVTSTYTLVKSGSTTDGARIIDPCIWSAGGTVSPGSTSWHIGPTATRWAGNDETGDIVTPSATGYGHCSLKRNDISFNLALPKCAADQWSYGMWIVNTDNGPVHKFVRFKPQGTFHNVPRSLTPVKKPVASVYSGGEFVESVTLTQQDSPQRHSATWSGTKAAAIQYEFLKYPEWWAGKLSDGRYVGLFLSDSIAPTQYKAGSTEHQNPVDQRVSGVGVVTYSPSSYQTAKDYRVRYPAYCYLDADTPRASSEKMMPRLINAECEYDSPQKLLFKSVATGTDIVIDCDSAGGSSYSSIASRPAISSTAPYVAGRVVPYFYAPHQSTTNYGFAPEIVNIVHRQQVEGRVVRITSSPYGSGSTDGYAQVFAVTDSNGWYDASVSQLPTSGYQYLTELLAYPSETYVVLGSDDPSGYLNVGKFSATTRCEIYITSNVGMTTVPLPVADFSGTPTTIDVGESVTFTDATTNTGVWSWTFGDGGMSGVQNPSHTYSSPGKFTVSLTAANAKGVDTKTRTNYITVNTVSPTADFTGSPLSGASPLAVDFTDSSSPFILTRSWSFGSTSANPTATFTAEGKHTVSLTVTNFNGSDTKSRTDYVTVYVPPSANFTGTPLSGVLPLEVSFTDTSTHQPVDYSWDFGDGGSSTDANPTHSYTSAGTYTVSLYVANPAGSDSKTRTDYVVVSDPPPPVADFSADVTTGTSPLEVTFTDSSSNAPTSWYWDFGDGVGDSYVQNPVYEYTATGVYTVTLTASNAGGSDSETKVAYITVV